MNWVQEEVAKFLQCSSMDSMLPSFPESGASLRLEVEYAACGLDVEVEVEVECPSGLKMSQI